MRTSWLVGALICFIIGIILTITIIGAIIGVPLIILSLVLLLLPNILRSYDTSIGEQTYFYERVADLYKNESYKYCAKYSPGTYTNCTSDIITDIYVNVTS